MSIAKYRRLQAEFLSAIGTDRHDAAFIPRLIAVAEAAALLRSIQLRGARDPNEHAMIAAAADKLDRAISNLEGAKL
jgi:hypothetical protein